MSVLKSSEEKTNGFKLMRLIVDGGTEALRNIFLKIHPGNLLTVLSAHHPTLSFLFETRRIITKAQWDKLYPHPPKISNIQEFDITLLVILLRNICGLSPPNTGWDAMPVSNDKSLEADIVRIRLFRNNFFGHVAGTDVSRSEFETRWLEVSSALVRFGLNQAEIDRLKAEQCGEEEVNRMRDKWSESDREVVSRLLELENRVQVIQDSSSDKILTEFLHCFKFENDIQSLYQRHTEGTREWVFDQVKTWLYVPSSRDINRALIISGPAGMGKSIIAAVACKRFSEHFAACHLFQYNNTRYNDPRFFLQSLARQLCNVVPEYKENLTRKLSGNKGKILDEMNIKGLSSMLFEEPFTKDDECVSFLHKSVKDWLVTSNHRYSINEKRGHETLVDICVSQMEILKQNEVRLTYDPATKYALQYGIPHVTEIKDVQVLTKLLDCVTDLEIVHASACIDVYKTLNNFIRLTGCNTYNSLSVEIQRTIETLVDIIKKFISILKNEQQSFLQHVEEQNIDKFSAKASNLINTRYRKLEYFDCEVGSHVTAMRHCEKVACVDILESEDVLVCGYENGQVELFSLSDFTPRWNRIHGVPDDVVKKQTSVMINSLYEISRFVVFHPTEKVIFPGQLDQVLNLDGDVESGPLNLEKEHLLYFTKCCFSPDKEKMATHYGNTLTIWDLVSNTKIISISCESELYSILFSADGRFLAATDSEWLYVYESEKISKMFSRMCCNGDPKVLISTFNLDSWYCWSKTNIPEGKSQIVNCYLDNEPVSKNFRSLPMNARAATLWQDFMKSDGSTWIDKLKDHKVFILSDAKALIFKYGGNILKLFTSPELIHGSIPIRESGNSILR